MCMFIDDPQCVSPFPLEELEHDWRLLLPEAELFDDIGNSALVYAAASGFVEAVEELSQNKALMNKKNIN